MERRVKERLIGASILVILIVLVVPELLSGPKPPVTAAVALLPKPSVGAPAPVRNVTVDLATNRPAIVDNDATASEDAHATVPTASAASAAPITAAASALNPSAPRFPVPVASKPAVETAAPSPISTAEWSVQIGSFAKRGNADNLVHQLKAKGFAAFDSSTGSGASLRFRVRVGPFADRAATERALAKLKAAGHAGTLVAPTH